MMIQHTHAMSLRGLHLLANHPQYALTLEEHVIGDGQRYPVICFHGDFANLSTNDVATLSNELFVFRMCFNGMLFTIENIPDDQAWESFLGLFGFQPATRLPCTDDQERRLLISPAIPATLPQ